MKLLCQLFLIFNIAIFSMPAHAQSFELADTSAGTTVTATIAPEAAARGRVVNIWVSAVYKGAPYFYNGSAWVPYTGGPYPVAMRGKVLATETKLVLAKDSNFTALPGADLYVGYGRNEEEMKTSAGKLKKIIKVEKKLKWGARPAQ
ncbi:MAG: hypothetical protein ACOH2B_09345 [Burkholderiaceae bacterium]